MAKEEATAYVINVILSCEEDQGVMCVNEAAIALLDALEDGE